MDESGLWSAFNHSWSYQRLQVVGVYVPRFVLVRAAASLYSASPQKHHPTGKQ